MIRRATVADIPAIVDIAIESVSQNPIPVKICRQAMIDTAKEAVGNNAHFVWVSEIEGEVVGAVCAVSQPSFWFERQQASVLLYYTKVPGEGIKLIRKMIEWAKSRPVIKVLVMELEPETDPRLIKILKRMGLSRESTNLCYVRGLSNE